MEIAFGMLYISLEQLNQNWQTIMRASISYLTENVGQLGNNKLERSLHPEYE